MAPVTVTLRQLRRDKGLTQNQLAQRAGVAQGSLSQWESGAVKPSLDSAKRLADALGISLDAMTAALIGQERRPLNARE